MKIVTVFASILLVAAVPGYGIAQTNSGVSIHTPSSQLKPYDSGACANNPSACAGDSSRHDRRKKPPRARIKPGGYDSPPGYYRDDKPRRKIRPPKYRDPGYYRPYPPDHGYVRISCRQARHVLQDHGFYRIHTRDCRGRYYSFRAYWNGHRYIVSIRSRDGRIVRVDPV